MVTRSREDSAARGTTVVGALRNDPQRVRDEGADPYAVRRGELGQAFRLGFAEFLTGALGTAGIVLLVGALTYAADQRDIGVGSPLHGMLAGVFTSSGTVGPLLQSIATTVVTVASITFSLLLVAIQQSASSFTAQAFDQFLRRRLNQCYVGFFVGLGAYAILDAASVHQGFVPVYGAALLILLTVVAVGLLLLLVYNAINQMRPAVIVESIHDHLVEARARQVDRLLSRTRREPQLGHLTSVPVLSGRTGFVVGYDLDRIQAAIDGASAQCEVTLELPIGRFLAYGDRMATVHAGTHSDAHRIAAAVENATRRAKRRNIDDIDAAFGLEQLATVGWTSTSGAKQNPQAARLVIAQLRDILARFGVADPASRGMPDSAIVYQDDVPDVFVRSIESLAVVTAGSQQHQIAADILDLVAEAQLRDESAYREGLRDVLVRALPALLSHPPTMALEAATARVQDALEQAGYDQTAGVVAQGLANLRARKGEVEDQYTPR